MRAEDILSEWKECRDTIGRFDGYLLKIRLLSVSVFTLLFTAITGMTGSSGTAGVFSHTPFMYALIALLLFIATTYILDRYYERMLLVAVLRASRLEAHQLEGFKVGLTTEIEFQKDQLHKPHWSAKFARASLMVNIAYGFMLAIVIVEYIAITWTSLQSISRIFESAPFALSVVAVILIFTISNFLLREPNELIEKRSKVVTSPVVFSRAEIEAAIDNVASSVTSWIDSNKLEAVNVISILTGARQFTEGLLKRVREKRPYLDIRVLPVRVGATKNNVAKGAAQILYGCPSQDILGNRATLIVDDLVDTGASLGLIKEIVADTGVDDIRTAVLVNKYAVTQHKADFVGLNLALEKKKLMEIGVSDYWLFGFGMDIDGAYREIDHIGWVPKKG